MESNAKNVVTRESVLAAVTKNGWALVMAATTTATALKAATARPAKLPRRMT